MKRCTRCGEKYPATPEYFNRRPESEDGLKYWCRQCTNAYNRAYRLKFPVLKARLQRRYARSNRIIRLAAEQAGIPFVPKETENRCPRCQETKPLTTEYFRRDLAQANGFHGYCRPCEIEYRNTRKEKKRVRPGAGTP